MSQFNGLPKINQLTNAANVSWASYRQSLKPRYHQVWLEIILGYACLSLGLIIFIPINDSLLLSIACIPVSGFWIAHWLKFVGSFNHEAAHYNIAPDRRWNDILAAIFLGSLLGLTAQRYRKTHLLHHLHLGTPLDTEISYHQPLTWTYVMKSLTGIYVVETLLRYGRRSKEIKRVSEGAPARDAQAFPWAMFGFLGFAALVNLAVVYFASVYISIYAGAAWVVGRLCINPFLGMLQQLVEHRSFAADPKADYGKVNHGAVNRMFSKGLFDRTFGSAGFNRHLLHHLDLSVSYTRFDEMEAFLMQTPLAPDIDRSRTTYFAAIKELLR